MLQNSFRIYILLLLFIILSCDRGGNILIVGSVKGPSEVPEGTTVEYSVDAEGDSGITYNWAVNPTGYGTLETPTSSSTTFTAPDVDSDFEIVIRVVVNSDNDGPVVRSLDVTVKDIADPPVNQPPTAGAYVTTSVVELDIEIQFFDNSTDPDGEEDIVIWEWDFTYDPDDGFQVDSTEKDPTQASSIEGIFLVQHRVEDFGGSSDMLDTPLEITVEWGPRPPVAAAQADIYTGQPGVEIQFFDDSTDPDGDDDIVLWEWDFSYDPDDGFIVESTEIEPQMVFPESGLFLVQLRVTDSTGLSDLLDEPLPIAVLFDRPVVVDAFNIGETGDDRSYGISVDPSGNIYLVGRTGGYVDLDPGEGVYELGSDSYSTFICKYDPDNFSVMDATHSGEGWSVGAQSISNIYELTSDGDGAFFISGELLTQGGYEQTLIGGTYLASFDSEDLFNWDLVNWNWTDFDGMTGYHRSYKYSPVACDRNGNIYYFDYYSYSHQILYTGYVISKYSKLWQGTSEDPGSVLIEFDEPLLYDSVGDSPSGVITLQHLSYDTETDARISHYKADGSLSWELDNITAHDDRFTVIRSDLAGNSFFLDINDNNVTKISPDGVIIQELNWDADADVIFVYDDGSFLVSGTFNETVDFDPGIGETLVENLGAWSGYVSFFDAEGNFQWVEIWWCLSGQQMKGIIADGFGNIYVSGDFRSWIYYGPLQTPSIALRSNGKFDIYVLKLSRTPQQSVI